MAYPMGGCLDEHIRVLSSFKSLCVATSLLLGCNWKQFACLFAKFLGSILHMRHMYVS